MLDAADKELLPGEEIPKRCANAVVPLLGVILTLGAGLVLEGLHVLNEEASLIAWAGEQAQFLNISVLVNTTQNELDALDYSLKGIIGKANPYHALLWSSMFGTVVAIALVCSQRILSLAETMDAWLAGVKGMIMALLILIHAWALANMCTDLHTAQWLVGAIGDLPSGLIPTVIFILSALISFATGSAWGTMSILFPLVMPLAYHSDPDNDTILLASTASILAGSVWGDHCSPIADTCIMSSMSCSCPHLEHVKTQGFYAVLIAIVTVVFGSLPVGFGIYPGWAALLICFTVQFTVLMIFGTKISDPYHQTPARRVFAKIMGICGRHVIDDSLSQGLVQHSPGPSDYRSMRQSVTRSSVENSDIEDVGRRSLVEAPIFNQHYHDYIFE